MAGGLVIQAGGASYGGRITPFVLVACLIAASGGLLFGYDLGISGGVTSMDSFLKEFFPSVLKKKNQAANEGQYCKFDNQLLTLFTSSLYLAALVASFYASSVTRIYGRKTSMFVGGLAFFIGSIINFIAINVEFLIVGRLLLGVGVGFANQSVPVYLCEMAPAKMRGALNMGFNMAVTIGILVAGLINCGTAKIKGGWGWRLSLVLAAAPAAVMIVGAIVLPDTPNSILERGNREKARQVLQKVRGMQNIDDEFQDLIDANEASKHIEHPWKNILQPRYRPQLTFCILIPCFQQLTGINVIMFYAPIIFQTLGFGDNASLMAAVITGSVNMFSTLVSIYSVDKFGRRILFLEGGIQMTFSQIAVGIMIAWSLGTNGEGSMTAIQANIILILICSYVASFAWSWGPLGWLVPSEICPLEIRSAGQAINVAVNMLFTFIIAQVFLTMLCHMKFGIFFFFAVFVVIMTAFIYFFLPETKNVSLKEMDLVWKRHWFWGSYIPDDVAFGTSSHKL